jgi:hypothetical protein
VERMVGQQAGLTPQVFVQHRAECPLVAELPQVLQHRDRSSELVLVQQAWVGYPWRWHDRISSTALLVFQFRSPALACHVQLCPAKHCRECQSTQPRPRAAPQLRTILPSLVTLFDDSLQCSRMGRLYFLRHLCGPHISADACRRRQKASS